MTLSIYTGEEGGCGTYTEVPTMDDFNALVQRVKALEDLIQHIREG